MGVIQNRKSKAPKLSDAVAADKNFLANTNGMMSFSHEQSTSLAQVPLWLLVELANELSTATNLETLQRILARKLRWIFNFARCTLAIGSQPTDTE